MGIMGGCDGAMGVQWGKVGGAMGTSNEGVQWVCSGEKWGGNEVEMGGVQWVCNGGGK